MKAKIIAGIILFIAAFTACTKEDMPAFFAGFQKPAHFPEPVYHFANNAVTKAGFELGRKLFYDPMLSANNTISCGTCHIQSAAFTQHGHAVSHGIFDRLGTRNSPPIMNMAWNNTFMWDGGIFDLDLQPVAPITNHVEMGDSMEQVIQRLRNSATYPALFEKAFGTPEISSRHMLQALSQFMVMCVSSNAKYDSVQRKEARFNINEEKGYRIFQQKCASCHAEPLFTDFAFRNNGLPKGKVDDKGRYMVTLQEKDAYTFKTPSLRNLAYTPPYMHDGRFFTLDAVLDHYAHGVQPTPNLDPQLQQGIPLNADERTALMAFLKTLNDKTFIQNPMLAEQ